MVPAYRHQFNASYSAAKYRILLDRLEDKCGTPVKFRVSETPCFFPKPLLDRTCEAGKELVHQLVGDPQYRAKSSQSIPAAFNVPNETPHPMFVQVDFGLVRDKQGELQPKLVELQAFPSLYAYQLVLSETYIEAFGLDRGLKCLLSGLDKKAYMQDRKSTRLNSSHRCISYAVFCLKKKNNNQ